MENSYFQKALSNFTTDFAVGGTIRALADKGLNVNEIYDRLDYPVSRETVGKLVWAHFLDNGTICINDPSKQTSKQSVSYEKIQDEYGRISYKQIKRSIELSGVYLPCDFGKQMYKNREAFIKKLEVLDKHDRDYILGLPWPLETVWHRDDERIRRIIQT